MNERKDNRLRVALYGMAITDSAICKDDDVRQPAQSLTVRDHPLHVITEALM